MSNIPHPRPGMPPFRIDAPGKNILMAAGIAFIIFNTMRLFSTMFAMMTINTWLWMFGGQVMRDTWMTMNILFITLSLFGVTIGIMGATFCNKIEKGRGLLVVAIIFMILSTIHNITYSVTALNFVGVTDFGGRIDINFGAIPNIQSMTGNFLSILGVPITIALSIFFIVGASKNKKAADNNDV